MLGGMNREEHVTIHLPGIARDLNRIADAAERIVHHNEARVREPAWASRLEHRMSEQSDAIARIETNLTSVSDEIAQVVTVLQGVQTDDPAVTAQLQSVADRLATAKDTLENATTLDDPPVEPPV